MSKKEVLFHKFSSNLSSLAEKIAPLKKLIPERGRYICPLALTVHKSSCLNEGSVNQLSLEHVPPEAMGGKAICLIRKDINSIFGHTVDNKVLQTIKARRFFKGESSIRGRVSFNLQRLQHIHANITILPGDVVNIVIDPGAKNMGLVEKEITNKGIWAGLQQQLSFSVPVKSDMEFKAALLRYAYLKAFAVFGYALIFGPKKFINPHYEIIRQQILSPQEQIIPFIPVFINVNIPFEGVGVVTSPEEMKSFISMFPLNLEGKIDYCSVFLPAPDDRGFSAYSFCHNNIGNAKQLNLQVRQIIPIQLDDPKAAFFPYHIWKNLNGVL